MVKVRGGKREPRQSLSQSSSPWSRHHSVQVYWWAFPLARCQCLSWKALSIPWKEISLEMQAGAATLESSIEVPQKTKSRTTLWPSNCTTRYLSMGYRYAVSKGHMHPNDYSNTNNSQGMERAQMSIDGWMDKEDVVCIYTMEYYSAIKKNEILPFATM